MPTLSGVARNSAGTLSKKIVRAYRRDTGELMGETTSNPSTGAWSITTTYPGEHLVLAVDAADFGFPVLRGSILTPGDASDNAYFGGSVALSNDGLVLAVGAYNRVGTGSISGAGGVYIFDWSGGAWVQRGSVIEAADLTANDNFGYSVALSSDGAILAIGAYRWEGGTSDEGGVYIYDWSGSAWVQRGSVLETPTPVASGAFGKDVAISGDGAILAVGESRWKNGSTVAVGAVQVFDWSGSAWVHRGTVTAADGASLDDYGDSVALNNAGTRLAVGAIQAEDGAISAQGAVYVYDWSGSAWVAMGATLYASDAAASDLFGSGVALSGDGNLLAVGANNWEPGAVTNLGGVYLFDLVGTAWIPRGNVLQASDAEGSDAFGFAVALSNDAGILAVGAPYWEGATGTARGGVYLHDQARVVGTGNAVIFDQVNPV